MMVSDEFIEKVYMLCNGIRDVPEISRALFGEGHGPNENTHEWRCVCKAVDVLNENGTVYMKDSGVLLDLQR